MTTEIKYDYLRNHPLFANVSEQKISEAASFMKTQNCVPWRNHEFWGW